MPLAILKFRKKTKRKLKDYTKVKNSLLIILLWISTSCATKVVSTDNFSITPYKPKTFLIHPANDYASLSVENKKLDTQLQEAIATSLEKKGLVVAATPDLYVSYLINVYPSAEVRNEPNYPYCGYNFMYPYTYSAANYEEGVLIINLTNHQGELVWQGTKPFNLTTILSAQDLLPNLCRKIIKTYNYTL